MSFTPFVFRAAVAAIYAFLLFAPLVVVYYSFSPTIQISFPPESLTLRWYANLFAHSRLLGGIFWSVVIGLAATSLALVVGVPGALALVRGRFPGRRALSAFFLAPINLPGVVLAVGVLMWLTTAVQPLTGWILVGSPGPLLAVHVLVTAPWVIRTVSASLELTDPHLEEAARGLGASPLASFFLVTLPAIRPGIVAGALFAFIVSFGNFALSLFFTSARVTTLPVAIFEYIDQYQDPTVAAASSLVILGTTLLVVLGERLRRRAGRGNL